MSKLIYTLLILSAAVIFYLSGCSVKNPVDETSVYPELSELTVSDTLYLQSDILYPFSVKVIDPQGLEDIQAVHYTVFMVGESTPVFQDTLADDGRNGDIIPRDGVYFGFLTPASVEGKAGSYRIGITAEDRGRHVSDTLFAAFSAINDVKNQSPVLSDPIVPDALVLDSLKNVFFSIRASDPQGLETIDSVKFQIFPPLSPIPVVQGSLHDDGTTGDMTARDGIFSYQQDMSEQLKIQGRYSLRFEAADGGGLKSSPVVVQFRVIRENAPPVLSNLSAPDSVSRFSSSPFLISVRVTDPQGLEDVKKVYFNTTKPDGSPSSGNPFFLLDDGAKGDTTAGDGIFSLIIRIEPENEIGVYRFDFFAEDQSGAISEPLIHTMTVTDQPPE